MKNFQVDKSIFKKYNVKLAYLFGSRAKGTSAKESDFDIAVLFKAKNGSQDFFEKTLDLQDSLRKYFTTKIDIVALNDAPSLLKYEVIANGIVLYSDDERFRIDYEVSSVKEYIDDQHFRNIYFDALTKRVEEGVF